jgi:hypothetical protein
MSDFHDLDRRVAVIEQIAQGTAATLARLDGKLDGLRSDVNRGFDRLAAILLWILGVMPGGVILGGYAGLFAGR